MKNNQKENKRKHVEVVALCVLTGSLLILVLGVSMAVFNYFGKGQTSNVIKTGTVTFSYSDAVSGRNGIYIEDALPISDVIGKRLSGSREYFDFSVMSTTTNTPISYEITAEKGLDSTIADSLVKVYLTSLNAGTEVDTPLTTNGGIVKTYSELNDTTSTSISGKTIYLGSVPKATNNYSKAFRLRMWIKDGKYSDEEIAAKMFSIKVNVSAIGAEK